MKDRHTHNVHLRLDTAAEVQEALAHACREGDDVSELRDLLAAKVDRATAILTLPEPYFPTYTLCTPFGDVEVRFEESQEGSRVVRFFTPEGAPLTVNRIDYDLRLFYVQGDGGKFRYDYGSAHLRRLDRSPVTDNARRKLYRFFDEAVYHTAEANVDLWPKAHRAALIAKAKRAQREIEYLFDGQIRRETENLNAALAELEKIDTAQ